MASLARPIVSYLAARYSRDSGDVLEDQDLAREYKKVSISSVTGKDRTLFRPTSAPKKRNTVSIQYEAKIDDIEAIRTHLRNRKMSAKAIGTHTFEYFLKQEGLR